MKFLAFEHENKDASASDFEPLLHSEARHVWELYQVGFIREAYFRADQTTAVLVLECPDEESAEQGLAELPLVQSGLIRFELIPLRPYPGWERLFGTET